MPISEELKEQVLKAHLADRGLSQQKLAYRFGIHKKSVWKILRAYSPQSSVEVRKSVETDDQTGDTRTISLPKTRISTLEELVEHCKIDLSVWEVERFIANKWEVGMRPAAVTEYMTTKDGRFVPAWTREDGEQIIVPLYQVKAFLRRRRTIVDAKAEIEQLKELAREYGPLPAPVVRKTSDAGLMLEVNIPDVHFGKLAWAVETGWKNYDTKIAVSIFQTALSTLLARVKGHKFEQVLFVVGNDLLNSDDIEGRTTAGTSVTTDARYQKTFATVRMLMIEAIEILRRVAPVRVVMVSGNHDKLSVWHLGDSLECWFNKYQDVIIDNLPRERKYHRFGQVMLMFTHGHKGKHSDYPIKMAVEQPEMFGQTKFRECHTGHKHKQQSDLTTMRDLEENHGVRVRILSALCPPDDWHSENGFVGNLRSADLFLWSKTEGLIGTATYTDVD